MSMFLESNHPGPVWLGCKGPLSVLALVLKSLIDCRV